MASTKARRDQGGFIAAPEPTFVLEHVGITGTLLILLLLTISGLMFYLCFLYSYSYGFRDMVWIFSSAVKFYTQSCIDAYLEKNDKIVIRTMVKYMCQS